MAEWAVILGIALHALSGVPGLVWRRTADSGQAVSVKMAVAGSGVGMLGALASLWAPPMVGGVIRMDGLSVIFLLPIFLVSALGGVYGLGYWSQARHPHNGRKLRLFYGLVTAALGLVTSFTGTLMFTALGSFFNRISDPGTGRARAHQFWPASPRRRARCLPVWTAGPPPAASSGRA